MKHLMAMLAVLAAVAAEAERRPLEDYQSIIDRQMFGKPPPGFDPTRPPNEVSKSEQRELTQEQEKLQSAVHFSVIRVSPEGKTQVGFTDNTDPKAPKHYVLAVGEEQDGWMVKEADAAEETMTIAKGDIEVSLKIGDNSGKGGGTTAKAGGNAAPGFAARRPMGGGLLGGGSLRARRLQRMEAQQAQAAEKAEREKAERDAVQAQEKAEREAERAQQREQLMAIQEELRKAREQRQQKSESNDENDAE